MYTNTSHNFSLYKCLHASYPTWVTNASRWDMGLVKYPIQLQQTTMQSGGCAPAHPLAVSHRFS
jgi:hypothetical protein